MISARESLTPFAAIIAQVPLEPSSWERLGISGIALATTVFIWRYFVGREGAQQTKRDDEAKIQAAADTADRNRILNENNRLQQQVVDLLRDQVAKTEQVALDLKRASQAAIRNQEDGMRSLKDITRKVGSLPREVTIANDPEHPVPVSLSPEDPS